MISKQGKSSRYSEAVWQRFQKNRAIFNSVIAPARVSESGRKKISSLRQSLISRRFFIDCTNKLTSLLQSLSYDIALSLRDTVHRILGTNLWRCDLIFLVSCIKRNRQEIGIVDMECLQDSWGCDQEGAGCVQWNTKIVSKPLSKPLQFNNLTFQRRLFLITIVISQHLYHSYLQHSQTPLQQSARHQASSFPWFGECLRTTF